MSFSLKPKTSAILYMQYHRWCRIYHQDGERKRTHIAIRNLWNCL